jgi:hypothetical protein
MQTPDVGIYRDIPFEDYCQWPYVNASLLCTVLEKTAGHARYEQTHDSPDTKALQDGRNVHLMLLEPDEFDSQVKVLPADAPRRPSSTQRNAKNPSESTIQSIEFWDAWEADGRTLVSADDYDAYLAMAKSVRSNQCKIYVTGGEAEVCIVWDDPGTGLRCKGRLDYLLDTGWGMVISDVKTTRFPASARLFRKTIFNLMYDLKAAWYMDGLAAITGQRPEFCWIVVEKQAPYYAKPYEMGKQTYLAGRTAWLNALNTWAECVRKDDYPAFGDDVETIELEEWQLRARGVAPFETEDDDQ